MNSKERIKKIFNHQIPEKIGVFDFFDNITITNWKKQTFLDSDVNLCDFFDFDLNFEIEKLSKTKFNFFALNGPFQSMVLKNGLQRSLMDFVREPRHTKDFFKSRLDSIIAEYKTKKQQCGAFDGFWLYEDMAYDNGLYFSIEKYKDMLFDFHKEIAEFFKSEGVPTVFHCDGDVEKAIPLLIKAGYAGIHPLQESCNPNILRIKKDLKDAIIFIGGVALTRLKYLHEDILDRIDSLKQDGNYIFCFDGPIPAETEFKIYDTLVTKIHVCGEYR